MYLNIVVFSAAVAIVFFVVVCDNVSVCVRYDNMYLQASLNEAR